MMAIWLFLVGFQNGMKFIKKVIQPSKIHTCGIQTPLRNLSFEFIIKFMSILCLKKYLPIVIEECDINILWMAASNNTNLI